MKRSSPKPIRSRRQKEAGHLLPAIVTLLVCVLPFVLAEVPSWWSDRGLVKKDTAGQPVEASDFAAANQGQLKNVAIAAYEEFLAKIPAALGGIGPIVPPDPAVANDKGSPGWRIRDLVQKWVLLKADGTVQRTNGKPVLAPGAAAHKDFAAITQGQLKSVAAPFYDRLAEIYWSYNLGTPDTSQIDPAWAKPWTDTPDDANNHVMANLGQLKRTFSLDLASDADRGGLTNLVELLANKQRSSSDRTKWTDLANAYTTGGVLTDGEQVGMGLDPTIAANGLPPDAPTGLHVMFPDAIVHPDDPDISQIQVEWDAPMQTGIEVSFQQTYAGNSAGWSSVSLPLPTQSPIFFSLPSKRVHEYRVTFKGQNGLRASADIAYEVPVIRGLMTRLKNGGPDTTSVEWFSFPGVLLSVNASDSAPPRKFRSYKYEWSYSTTYISDDGEKSGGTSGYGQYTQAADLGTHAASLGTGTYGDGWYSEYDASTGMTDSIGTQVSKAATDYILDWKKPADFMGDGLVEARGQRFPRMQGVPLGIEIADPVVSKKNILHTEAPAQVQDLATQLNAVTGGWIKP